MGVSLLTLLLVNCSYLLLQWAQHFSTALVAQYATLW